jgi:hypothetical protein
MDETPEANDLWRAASGSSLPCAQQLVSLASRHWVSAAIVPFLDRKGHRLSPDIQEYFEGAATLNRMRNNRIRLEALAITEIFNEIGVVPVFLKGAANLLSELYPDTAVRIMLDLDILVPAARIQDCVAAMEAHGYAHLIDNGFPDHHHYFPLGRPDVEASIELHVDPLDIQYRRFLSSADVFQHSEQLTIGGARFAVPAAWCRLIHCIAHAQFSNHALIYGRLPLRELIDTVLLSRTGSIDWDTVSMRFTSLAERTALAFHLLAANRLLGAGIAERCASGPMAKLLFQRARFLLRHPHLDRWTEILLGPWLELWRSLSHPRLRRRFLRSLLDPTWRARQWHTLWRSSN